MDKYSIGYTQGTFDMFHVGHLNLLVEAKKRCDYLIVGVNSDELVREYKKHDAVICEDDRNRIIQALRCVDESHVVHTLNKSKIHDTIRFDAIFIGDDWKDNNRWIQTRKDMEQIGVSVVFLPYTQGVSSTQIKQALGLNNVEKYM